MRDGRSRVPPLQGVDRGGRNTRLLDDDRSGADPRALSRSAGRLGADTRDRGRVRRAADLRLGDGDYVLARVLLLLRAPEEELSAAVRLSRPRGQGAAGAARRAEVLNQRRLVERDELR